MKIDELQSYAKKNGFDSVRFKFTNFSGEIKFCKWIDAYFGLFAFDGESSFITISQWKELTNDFFDFEIVAL